MTIATRVEIKSLTYLLPHNITAVTAESFVVKIWSFPLITTMFGWSLVKKLNLLILNLLGAFKHLLRTLPSRV